MRRIADRYGPTSPGGRAVASAVFGAIGFGALSMVLAHLFAIQFEFTEQTSLLLTFLVGLAFTTLAYVEAEAVVRRAKAAPEPPRATAGESGRRREESAADSDPVAELQRRYAEGELSTEAFEERVDRLVETGHRVDESDAADLVTVLTVRLRRTPAPPRHSSPPRRPSRGT